jgi:dolichyl-phosphate mannosyltransferase polypeptide 2 regulatory subunit
MGVTDKALGGSMLFVAAAVFIYYTTWAILLPFFDISSPIHEFFPPREWAVRLPAFILVAGLGAVGSFIGTTIIKENRRKAEKARLRTA